MYQIKPNVINPDYAKARNEKKEQIRERKERKSENKRQSLASQEKLTKEVVESNEGIASSITESSRETDKLLLSLKDEIAQIALEIPPSEDGDKISKSLNENAQRIEASLNTLINSISGIKLETQTLDLKPHTQEITKTISANIDGLKTSIKELTDSVKEIEFEHPPLVMLSYRVTRDKEGLIEEIHPIAPDE